MQDYGNVDQILTEVNAEPAPAAPEAAPPQAAAPEVQAAPEQPKEFQFNWNGQQIKGREEDVLKWASQGYDYSQRMNQLQQQTQELEQKFSPFKEIDQFAAKNPDWWQHVEKQYQEREKFSIQQSMQVLSPEQRQAFEPLFNRVTEELSKTKAELAEMREFQTQDRIAKQEAEARNADLTLQQEIDAVGKEYGFNLKERDESGQTIEWKVGQLAAEKGYSFRDAFYLYNRDAIRKADEMRIRESMMKEFQANRRSGLLPDSGAPFGNDQPVPRMRSYDDGLKFAMKDLGL